MIRGGVRAAAGEGVVEEVSNGWPVMPNKSRKGLYIGLAVAAVLLLSCCCLGSVGGIGAYYFVYLAGESNPKVTKENFDKLKVDMTLNQIEELLGPGKPTTVDDVKAAFKFKTKAEQDKIMEEHALMIGRGADYRWKNGDETIFVIFKSPAKENGKAGYLVYVKSTSGSNSVSSMGFMPK
jgi:hypothetical protein